MVFDPALAPADPAGPARPPDRVTDAAPSPPPNPDAEDNSGPRGGGSLVTIDGNEAAISASARSVATTRMPRSRKRATVARPRPPAAPVINATGVPGVATVDQAALRVTHWAWIPSSIEKRISAEARTAAIARSCNAGDVA